MPKSSAPLRQLKILVVGDKDTGKHCYVRRLIDNKYPRDSWTNKECDTWPLQFKVDQDTPVSVQIYIIHGSERGKSILKKYYKNTDGYIVIFDVANPESYDNATSWKINVDEENVRKPPPSIVLANKCDLEKDEGVEMQMQGINGYCEAVGFCAYFETSSRDNTGIQQSFQHLIREIMQASTTSSSPPPSSSVPVPPETRSRSSTLTRFRTHSISSIDASLPLPKQEYRIKILVIGELATGKTAMIQRYVKNTFSGHYRSTIGADIAYKKLYYQNAIVNVQIWDIAGDERFGVMTHLFYKEAAGCLIVFDESRASTLNGAVKWKDDFDNKINFDANNEVPCVLAGNKCDLQKEGIVKSETHMTDFCQAHQFIRWFETSARDNINIAETFTFLINEIMENLTNRTGARRRSTTSDTIRIHDPPRSNDDTEHRCCSN